MLLCIRYCAKTNSMSCNLHNNAVRYFYYSAFEDEEMGWKSLSNFYKIIQLISGRASCELRSFEAKKSSITWCLWHGLWSMSDHSLAADLVWLPPLSLLCSPHLYSRYNNKNQLEQCLVCNKCYISFCYYF